MSEMRLSSSSGSSNYSGGYSYSSPSPLKSDFPKVDPNSPAFKALSEAFKDQVFTNLPSEDFKALLSRCDTDPDGVLEEIREARAKAVKLESTKALSFPQLELRAELPPLEMPSLPTMQNFSPPPPAPKISPDWAKERALQQAKGRLEASRERREAAAEEAAQRKAEEQRLAAESARREEEERQAAQAALTEDRIHFSCGCGRKIQSGAHHAGREAACPACNQEFIVPNSSGVIVFACSCGKAIQAKEQHSGRNFRCPECAEVLQVPMV